AACDAAAESFATNLRGLTSASADLPKLTLRLRGYRFEAKPPYTQRQGTTCAAHIELTPFRTWQVSVAVPTSSTAIVVQVQSPNGSTLAKSTPVVIPRELTEWAGPLDWSTRLTIEVFPSPGDQQNHYTVPLRADNLDASGTDADNRATTCRPAPGRLCHGEEDIRNILRSKVKVVNVSRGNEYARE